MKTKSLVVVIAFLAVMTFAGALRAQDTEITLGNHPGVSQALVASGCDISWTAWVVTEYELEPDDFAKLPPDFSFQRPVGCENPAPEDIAAKSRAIFDLERTRLKQLHAEARKHEGTVPPIKAALKNAGFTMISVNDLEQTEKDQARLKEQVVTLTRERNTALGNVATLSTQLSTANQQIAACGASADSWPKWFGILGISLAAVAILLFIWSLRRLSEKNLSEIRPSAQVIRPGLFLYPEAPFQLFTERDGSVVYSATIATVILRSDGSLDTDASMCMCNHSSCQEACKRQPIFIKNFLRHVKDYHCLMTRDQSTSTSSQAHDKTVEIAVL